MNKTINFPYPEIEYTDTHFYIVFKQSKEYLKLAVTDKKVGDKVGRKGGQKRWVEKLAESQKKIIDLIELNPKISKKEMSSKIGITTTAIDKNIERLKRQKNSC